MLLHLSVIPRPLAALISHPPHYLVFPPELCGPENDLAQKRAPWSYLHTFSLYDVVLLDSSLHLRRRAAASSARRNTKQPYSDIKHRPVTSIYVVVASLPPCLKQDKENSLKDWTSYTHKKSRGICAFVWTIITFPFPHQIYYSVFRCVAWLLCTYLCGTSVDVPVLG